MFLKNIFKRSRSLVNVIPPNTLAEHRFARQELPQVRGDAQVLALQRELRERHQLSLHRANVRPVEAGPVERPRVLERLLHQRGQRLGGRTGLRGAANSR